MSDHIVMSSTLKGADGPSRVLDFELHILLVEDKAWPARDRRGRIINPNARMSDYLSVFRDVIDVDDQDFDFPRYTSAMDAAITLIPQGWEWTLYSDASGEIYRDVPPNMLPGAPGSTTLTFAGSTLSIALCVAALVAVDADNRQSVEEVK